MLPMFIISRAAGRAPIYDMSDLQATYTDAGTPTQTYGVTIFFRTDGTIDVTRVINANLNDEQDPYIFPTSYISGASVRCAFVSGQNLTAGDAVDTWHPLSSQRSFTITYATSGGFDQVTGNFTLELSNDGGSTIRESHTQAITVGESA